jgi:hypothetical protein
MPHTMVFVSETLGWETKNHDFQAGEAFLVRKHHGLRNPEHGVGGAHRLRDNEDDCHSCIEDVVGRADHVLCCEVKGCHLQMGIDIDGETADTGNGCFVKVIEGDCLRSS